MNFHLLILILLITFTGCMSPINISLTSNINDFVMMGIKPSKEKPRFTFKSKIVDGNTKPFEKDRLKPVPSHPGYIVRQSSTLRRMLDDYMQNKYPGLNQDSSSRIDITLEDFWIEMYTEASSGQQFSTVMFGGETEWIMSCKVKANVVLNINGEQYTKTISATAEDKFIRGVGTGTNTSNIYQGSNSPEAIHARNINSANNKLLMMLNSYLGEFGL